MPLCMTIRHDGVITPGIVVRMINGHYCIPFFEGDVNDTIDSEELDEEQDKFCVYLSKANKPKIFERPKNDGTSATEKYILEGYMDMQNFTLAGSSTPDTKKHLLVCVKKVKEYDYKHSLKQLQWVRRKGLLKDFILMIPNDEKILYVDRKPVRLQYPRNT